MPARLAVLILVLQCCGLCAPIRVPIVWDGDGDNSEVQPAEETFSVEQFKPKDIQHQQQQQQPIPNEYFEYTAKKPQFAADIAAFHGVQSPQEHYKAHPVRPFTGKTKPQLGHHRIQDSNRPVFHQFQEYINQNEPTASHVTPVSSNYEVFHPYKAEEPGLQEIYKDPILDKIRNDIRDSSQRLEKQENDDGKPDVSKEEYLESPEETDRKKLPQMNVPVPYEIHRPQRRPVYYRPVPIYSNRDHVLNNRFKHPWNQNFVKIRPVHYRPLKHHLQKLRHHHALTYDDERNQYPQIPIPQHYEEPSEGYDIYEKGKEKYVNLRNNLDESINDLVLKNHPVTSQKLELQSEEKPEDDEEEEFIPIKNYAQVRKTETTKHLPKSAAFDEAENYEEIKNAPRLREAIKSTKAQTVYTEEGYEDSAYDHAGEQKHASDHEAHGGFLKENELSGGKYKAPSVSASYKDGGGSGYKDQVLDGKIWKENNKDTQKEEDSEDYSEDEHEHLVEADKYSHGPISKDSNARNKRQDLNISHENISTESEQSENSTSNDEPEYNNSTDQSDIIQERADEDPQHDVIKRETNFKVPEIDLDSTYLTEKEILEIAKEKIVAKDITQKYPYYFKTLKSVNKNSPIRYAENLKFMPRKTDGGTEFYDSRSQLECPEVDDKVDALPEKLNKKGHPDEPEEGAANEKKESGDSSETLPRLTGLGDKIDCFKAKYFGENPLDSPFFNEEIISEPEPVILPNLAAFKLQNPKDTPLLLSPSNNMPIQIDNLTSSNDGDLYDILQKLKNKNKVIKDSLTTENLDRAKLFKPEYMLAENNFAIQSDTKSNKSLETLKDYLTQLEANESISSGNSFQNDNNNNYELNNITNSSQPLLISGEASSKLRQKRAAPFTYEPYKIIRDVQPDSKKTTTTGNISPLIKQLQSSKVIDAVVKSNNDKDQPLKVSLGSRSYKDIGKKDRERIINTDSGESSGASIVDVNVDKRRGEPRYEIRHSNHKTEYSPVENKKAMSVQEYELHSKNSTNSDSANNPRRPSARSLFNIANNVQKSDDLQNLQGSGTIRRTVTSSPQTIKNKKEPLPDEDVVESDEDYEDEYDDDDEEEEPEEVIPRTTAKTTTTTTSTTTTTTIKPSFRKRMRIATTTEPPIEENTEEPPKLRLVTRFRNSHLAKQTPEKESQHKEADDITLPKYREKKKTSTKSTLLTDTKKYGDDDDDDMRKEDIDALIGVKQNMNEYMPMYEKEALMKKQKNGAESSEEENSEEDDEDEYEDDDDEDEDEEDEDEEDSDDDHPEEPPKIVTTESPKRTLARTTDAPPSTTEARSAKLEAKPIISRKKIAIHNELPVNKSSPHITQFKQDIEEVEIIKEIPRKATEKKPNKNLEVLDLYKDDDLATDINKLGAVEVFSENLDLKNGPKHGGNYRRAPELEEQERSELVNGDPSAPNDAEASQTQHKKLVELGSNTSQKMHGGNLKSVNDAKRSRGEKKFAQYVELKDITEKPTTKTLHGGNLKAVNDRSRRRGGNRSEKLIEFSDDHDDEDDDATKPKHGGNFKPYSGANSRNSGRGLHGGNYRSSRLVQAEDAKDESNTRLEKAKTEAPKKLNSADLLNSFALAVPILTTTPSYILDPSKRMYYYVDT